MPNLVRTGSFRACCRFSSGSAMLTVSIFLLHFVDEFHSITPKTVLCFCLFLKLVTSPRPPLGGATDCDRRVCVSVFLRICLSTRVSQTSLVETSWFFAHATSGRGSLCTSGFVNDVIFNIIYNRRNYALDVHLGAVLQHFPKSSLCDAMTLFHVFILYNVGKCALGRSLLSTNPFFYSTLCK